jgi:serine/threonine-protein kinase RsbT
MGRALPSFRVCVHIRDETDVVVARRRTRELAAHQGLSEAEAEALATAVTEIARNIVVHAGSGEMRFGVVDEATRRGVVVNARDTGSGIPQIEEAMQDGFSTRGGLGFGLPGARRLVDEFEIESEVGAGTTVTLWKWAVAESR